MLFFVTFSFIRRSQRHLRDPGVLEEVPLLFRHCGQKWKLKGYVSRKLNAEFMCIIIKWLRYKTLIFLPTVNCWKLYCTWYSNSWYTWRKCFYFLNKFTWQCTNFDVIIIDWFVCSMVFSKPQLSNLPNPHQSQHYEPNLPRVQLGGMRYSTL